MTPFKFHTADVFTDRAFAGNQLAVLPDARGLSDAQMQAIAREFNYAETVFAFPPEDERHTRRLRIFTPGEEVPFAGHPNVGAAHVLVAIGAVPVPEHDEDFQILFEEKIGLVPVRVRLQNGQPVFCQLTAPQQPEVGPTPPEIADIASVIGLKPADLLNAGRDFPESGSCGLPFLFVPVRRRETLGRIRFRQDRWEAVLAKYWAPHVFAFTTDSGKDGVDVCARMFAPSVGVPEDPATGSAAAALAGYLGRRDRQADGTLRWVIEQGVEMGRPSRIEIEADKEAGQIRAVRVGGSTVMVCEGTLSVPDS